jgi:EPS-associated MarR family transcriptional regulator
MTSRRNDMREDVRFRILKLLEDCPEMSQRDLAQATGVSLGSVNYCLAALVNKGFVKLGNFSAAHDKRRYAYILTPKGLAAKTTLTRQFLTRKRAEYEALKAEIDALQADLAGAPEKTK